MDEINGIPFIRDQEENNALLGSLFPQGTAFNSIQAYPESIRTTGNFKDISRSIWNEMREGTSYEVITDCDKPFAADFYNGGINYKKLVKFLVDSSHDTSLVFNYADFIIENPVIEASKNATIFSRNYNPFPKPVNTGFVYKNEQGRVIQANLSGNLNKRVCYIDEDFGYVLKLDAKSKTFTATLQFYYDGTRDKRQAATDTVEEDDFRIEDKYIAISLKTNSITDFLYLVKEVQGTKEFEFVKKRIAKIYADKIKATKNGEELKVLYETVPKVVLYSLKESISFEVMYSHILQLTAYDDTGILSYFLDGSAALINLLTAIGDTKKLFQNFKNNPALLKRIYYNLDGSSLIDEVAISNRVVFSNLLRALCVNNGFEGLENTGQTFYYGQDYKFNANAVTEDDREKTANAFYLQQLKINSKYIPERTMTSPTTGVPSSSGGYTAKSDEAMHSGYYGPLTMVYLVAADAEDKTPMAVPAICIKALSDDKEWQDIHRNIRVGADILAIVLGVATLGAASPLLLAMAVADIALSAADLGVLLAEEELEKTPEGREFLAAWDKIMLIGGITTAGPLLIKGVLGSGGKLLSLARKPATIQELKNCLVQVLQKSGNIANFVKGNVEVVTDIAREFGTGTVFANLKTLQQFGALLVKGEVKVSSYTEKGYVLLYKGEVVAQGNFKKFYDELTSIFKRVKNGRFEEVLEGVIDISVLKKNSSFNTILLKAQKKQYLSRYLNAEEEAVIIYYTTFAYEKLNQALRGIIPMDAENQAFANLLNKALDKLPKNVYNSSGNKLYRSFYMDELQVQKLYKKGELYTEKAFMSVSYDYDNFVKYWLADNPRHNVLMKVEGKHGKLVDAISDIPEESEVIFKSGSSFDVVNITKDVSPVDNISEIILIVLKEK